MANKSYKMTISLNVLNHLGINLYSNIPAVLAEVVANAWDADAETVGDRVEDDEIGEAFDLRSVFIFGPEAGLIRAGLEGEGERCPRFGFVRARLELMP